MSSVLEAIAPLMLRFHVNIRLFVLVFDDALITSIVVHFRLSQLFMKNRVMAVGTEPKVEKEVLFFSWTLTVEQIYIDVTSLQAQIIFFSIHLYFFLPAQFHKAQAVPSLSKR